MIQVLLADDHPVVRSGYRRLLEETGDIRVAAEAATGEAAYAAWVQQPVDVLVTDLSMPGGGGLALLQRLHQRDPGARMLVFSMHDGALLVRQALEAGARGFLTKASAPECLVDAVRALHAGQRWLDPALPPDLLNREPSGEAGRLASLSSREFEIFRLLALGRSPAECAEALCLSPKTVSNHQTLIKEKLGVATSAALAHLALRHRVIETAGFLPQQG
jgi:DNA-binding NarL/FixJ family response regulator